MDNRLPDLIMYDLIEKMELGDTIILTFKKKSEEFLSPYTNEIEMIPEVGDLAIFWDPGKESQAIVARLIDRDFAVEYQEYPYMASTRKWFKKAIKFRNPDQFDKIIKYKDDVAKKVQKD